MNDTSRPRLVSEHRLARLSLWLALSVAWFAAHVLTRLAPRAAGHALKEHARHARLLLVLRAVKLTAFRRGIVHADMRRLTCRAVAGAALRRALRTGAPRQRACAICAALAAPERWVALIAKRLQRRFTKLRRLPTPPRIRENTTPAPLRMSTSINSLTRVSSPVHGGGRSRRSRETEREGAARPTHASRAAAPLCAMAFV